MDLSVPRQSSRKTFVHYDLKKAVPLHLNESTENSVKYVNGLLTRPFVVTSCCA
jgi:hypothetical protein